MQQRFEGDDVIQFIAPIIGAAVLMAATGIALAQTDIRDIQNSSAVTRAIDSETVFGQPVTPWTQVRLAATSLVKPSAVAAMEIKSVVRASEGDLVGNYLAMQGLESDLAAAWKFQDGGFEFIEGNVIDCPDQTCVETFFEDVVKSKKEDAELVFVANTSDVLEQYGGRDYLFRATPF